MEVPSEENVSTQFYDAEGPRQERRMRDQQKAIREPKQTIRETKKAMRETQQTYARPTNAIRETKQPYAR